MIFSLDKFYKWLPRKANATFDPGLSADAREHLAQFDDETWSMRRRILYDPKAFSIAAYSLMFN